MYRDSDYRRTPDREWLQGRSETDTKSQPKADPKEDLKPGAKPTSKDD